MSLFAAAATTAISVIAGVLLHLAFLRGFAKGRRFGHREAQEARKATAVQVITPGRHGAKSLDDLIQGQK